MSNTNVGDWPYTLPAGSPFVNPYHSIHLPPPSALPPLMVPDPTRVIVRGESHMVGRSSPSGDVPDEQTWPYFLDQELPTSTVVVRALGGTTAEEAALRAGAITPVFALQGTTQTFPATNNPYANLVADVRFRTTSGPTPADAGALSVATSTGTTVIRGTLQRQGLGDGSVYSFWRSAAGIDIPNVTSMWFVSDDRDLYGTAVQIIGSAVNDSVAIPGETIRQAVGRCVTATCAMVEAQRSTVKRTLLVGSLIRANDGGPSPWLIDGNLPALNDVNKNRREKHYVVWNVEHELARIYPSLYYDLRHWIQDSLMGVAGLTEGTAPVTINGYTYKSDRDNRLEDALAPQLTHDGQHIKTQFASHIGARLAAELKSRGWV